MALVVDPQITALATAIVDAIIGGKLLETEKAKIVTAKEKELKLILQYLVANAQVGTTVAVTSVSAVTPGPGVSGPGAGTGTGKIT